MDTPAALRALQGSCLLQMWPCVQLLLEPAVLSAHLAAHGQGAAEPSTCLAVGPFLGTASMLAGACWDQEQLWRLKRQSCAAQPMGMPPQHCLAGPSSDVSHGEDAPAVSNSLAALGMLKSTSELFPRQGKTI